MGVVGSGADVVVAGTDGPIDSDTVVVSTGSEVTVSVDNVGSVGNVVSAGCEVSESVGLVWSLPEVAPVICLIMDHCPS